MTDTTPAPEDAAAQLRVENALLRGSLWMTARRLKDYQDAPAAKLDQDGREMLQVTIPSSLRESAAEALTKAQEILPPQALPPPTRFGGGLTLTPRRTTLLRCAGHKPPDSSTASNASGPSLWSSISSAAEPAITTS